MTQYICWSGGCDSTLLLYWNAKNNPNDTINAISIVIDEQNTQQRKMEKKTREKLKKLLPKNIKYHEIRVKTELSNMTWQMPIWACYVIPTLSDGDTLKMAYLSSDGKDFWLKRDDLVKSFEALMKLQGKPNCKILFPYEENTKGWIIQQLKAIKLYKYTWYCGSPKGNKPCKKCMKCKSAERWSKYPDHGEDV